MLNICQLPKIKDNDEMSPGFFETYINILQAVEELLEKRRIIPSLILIYTAIDGFSSLANRDKPDKGRSVFMGWVKTWMLNHLNSKCNEKDLYSARCAVLHQMVSESEMTREGDARRIYYTWGNRESKSLQIKLDNSPLKDSALAVKVEDIFWAFRRGMSDCMQQIEKDQSWQKSFDKKAEKLFISIHDPQ